MSTQSFHRLVLQVLASTQVISAFGTPGTREYSVISAFGTPGTESFKMTGTRESLAGYCVMTGTGNLTTFEDIIFSYARTAADSCIMPVRTYDMKN